MSGVAFQAVQDAIWAVLPAVFTAHGATFYKVMQPDSVLPYGSFGPFMRADADTKNAYGDQIIVQIDVFTQKAGYTLCSQIMDSVVTALLGITSYTGYTTRRKQIGRCNIFEEEGNEVNDLVQHGIVELELDLKEN